MKYNIYTDGSSRGNPGKAGWAVILLKEDKLINEYGGHKSLATNSEMEIYAVLYSLAIIIKKCKKGDTVNIYSDSNYVVQAVNLWMNNWKKDSWKKADKKEIAHIKYWQEIYDKYNNIKSSDINIIISHIKAHNGHKYNERADEICTQFAINGKCELYNE